MLISKCLKHEKIVFIEINIFLSEAPLIKTSWLLILNTFVGPSAAIRTPLPSAHLFGTEEFVFQNWTVPSNYGV